MPHNINIGNNLRITGNCDMAMSPNGMTLTDSELYDGDILAHDKSITLRSCVYIDRQGRRHPIADCEIPGPVQMTVNAAAIGHSLLLASNR